MCYHLFSTIKLKFYFIVIVIDLYRYIYLINVIFVDNIINLYFVESNAAWNVYNKKVIFIIINSYW